MRRISHILIGGLLFCCLLINIKPSMAANQSLLLAGVSAVHANFLVIGSLRSFERTNSIDYKFIVNHCGQIDSVSFIAGSREVTYGHKYFKKLIWPKDVCSMRVRAEGAQSLHPRAGINFKNGTEVEHSERFSLEKNRPTGTVKSIELTRKGNYNAFLTSVIVKDDVDLSSLKIGFLAFFKKALEDAGGVVSHAKHFSKSEKIFILVQDEQALFTLETPVSSFFSASDLVKEAVYSVRVEAKDSSGNLWVNDFLRFGDSLIVH